MKRDKASGIKGKRPKVKVTLCEKWYLREAPNDTNHVAYHLACSYKQIRKWRCETMPRRETKVVGQRHCWVMCAATAVPSTRVIENTHSAEIEHDFTAG